MSNAADKIREAFPDIQPSAGHNSIDELIGLLRVAHSQRDDAERRVGQLSKRLKAVDDRCIMCPVEVRNLTATAKNLLNAWYNPDRLCRIPERIEALADAVKIIELFRENHFKNDEHSSDCHYSAIRSAERVHGFVLDGEFYRVADGTQPIYGADVRAKLAIRSHQHSIHLVYGPETSEPIGDTDIVPNGAELCSVPHARMFK